MAGINKQQPQRQQQQLQQQQLQQQQLQQQKQPGFGSQFLRGAVLPTAIGTGLGALSQLGRAGGNPGLIASTIAGSGVKSAGNITANYLSQRAPNSKLAAIGAGALATAGHKFEEANRENALRTGSSGKGFSSGLGAGLQGLLEGGVGVIPGGQSLSRGVAPLLGGLVRTIGTGDASHLLRGLGGGAFNIVSSPTLGNDMSQLLTKSKASDYAGGRWGYNAQNKQTGSEAENASQPQAPQPPPQEQPGQVEQTQQAVQPQEQAVGGQEVLQGQAQTVPDSQGTQPGQVEQTTQGVQGVQQEQSQEAQRLQEAQPGQEEQASQGVQGVQGGETQAQGEEGQAQQEQPQETQRLQEAQPGQEEQASQGVQGAQEGETQAQGEEGQGAQQEQQQAQANLPKNPLIASLKDVPAQQPMPAARTASDRIVYESEDAGDINRAGTKTPLEEIESKRPREVEGVGGISSDMLSPHLKNEPAYQKASLEEKAAMMREQNRQMNEQLSNRSKPVKLPDIGSYKERRREEIGKSALRNKQFNEEIKRDFKERRWPRVVENAKTYDRVKNESEQQYNELEKEGKGAEYELSRYINDEDRKKKYIDDKKEAENMIEQTKDVKKTFDSSLEELNKKQQEYIETLNYDPNTPEHYRYLKKHNLSVKSYQEQKRKELKDAVYKTVNELKGMSSKLPPALKGKVDMIGKFVGDDRTSKLSPLTRGFNHGDILKAGYNELEYPTRYEFNVDDAPNMLIGEINELNQVVSDMGSGYEENLKKVEEEYNAPIDRLKAKKDEIARRIEEERKRIIEVEPLKKDYDKYERVRNKFGL
ncbi:MAG: hypothetical protein LBU10_01225 [Endomicrobium sp.]|jgi:hypothetical protein|nr:hypothetical protein [Endomicrobium sp.]